MICSRCGCTAVCIVAWIASAGLTSWQQQRPVRLRLLWVETFETLKLNLAVSSDVRINTHTHTHPLVWWSFLSRFQLGPVISLVQGRDFVCSELLSDSLPQDEDGRILQSDSKQLSVMCLSQLLTRIRLLPLSKLSRQQQHTSSFRKTLIMSECNQSVLNSLYAFYKCKTKWKGVLVRQNINHTDLFAS